MTLYVGGKPKQQGPLWRPPPKWIQHSKIVDKVPRNLNQYWEDNEGAASDFMVWDAAKAVIRGTYR